MATTLVHEPPAAAKPPATDGLRFVAIRANLLPDEIVSARQLEVVRKQVVLGLVLVVGLLIGWFGLSWWQTTLAHGDLDDAQHQAAALEQQQSAFAPLVAAQVEAAGIRTQLHTLMAADVPWKTVIGEVRSHAPGGVALNSIAASISAGNTTVGAGPAPVTPLSVNGTVVVGQITVTGRANTKNAVAAYADSLNRVHGLTGSLITSVTAQGDAVTFTLNVAVTTDALGGRFGGPATPAITSTTPGNASSSSTGGN